MIISPLLQLRQVKEGAKPVLEACAYLCDILGWFAAGMSMEQILQDFNELTKEDIIAALSYAADRENKTYKVAR